MPKREKKTDHVSSKEAEADAIFASIGDGAIATNKEGKIVRINHVALDILGFKSEDILNKWYPNIINAEDDKGYKISTIELPITKSLLSGEPVSKKITYIKKDKTKVPVNVTVSPIILNNLPIGAIEVFRDITEEVELDKSKSEFISLATHQLKTPPGALIWNLELLLDGSLGKVSKEQEKILVSMVDVTKKMIETVDSLLNVSRLELNTFIVDPVPTNFVKLADTVLEELKPQIITKEIKVKTNFDKNIPDIPSDPGLAKIIFENLLSNAVKYTPAKGSVTLSIINHPKNKSDSILITVTDTGYGIPLNQQKQIFTKMFRADNVKSAAEGTGLGLYLLKSIVEFSEGKVWFKSKENEGTSFYVIMPYKGMTKKEGTSKLS